MRSRWYASRKGPLIVYGNEGSTIVKAFRNLPGVEAANVERLNLLKLAPGGHLGLSLYGLSLLLRSWILYLGRLIRKQRKRMGMCCLEERW